MKVLNLILSVLILLLAAVSAASSYLLFVKRGQMVKGWEKMATAINQTAAELDKGSGTKVAGELSADALSHANYDSLDPKLTKLREQAKVLVAQRDSLADAVRKVATIIEMNNIPELEAYSEVAKYSTSKEDTLSSALDFKNRRDGMIKNIVDSAKKAGVTLDAAALKGAGSATEFKKFADKVDGIRGQFTAYQNSMRNIAKIAGASAPVFDDNSYAASLSKIDAAVRELKSSYDNALSQVEAGKRELAQAADTIKQRDGQIGTMESTIKAKDSEISQYRKALGIGDNEEFKPWQPGSEESRRAVRGKVVELNEKFGFLAVDLGKNSVVIQQVGNRTSEVNPEIANGMEMYVARYMDTSDVQYVARIRLTNVDADCSIAETFELAPDQKIKVGDAVFFYIKGQPKADQAPAAAPAEKASEKTADAA
jgi:hypothetical protein